jgi:hypothetical protein
MDSGEEGIRALERALIEAWEVIPDQIFQSVLDSMPTRVKALIEAEEWHAKY